MSTARCRSLYCRPDRSISHFSHCQPYKHAAIKVATNPAASMQRRTTYSSAFFRFPERIRLYSHDQNGKRPVGTGSVRWPSRKPESYLQENYKRSLSPMPPLQTSSLKRGGWLRRGAGGHSRMPQKSRAPTIAVTPTSWCATSIICATPVSATAWTPAAPAQAPTQLKRRRPLKRYHVKVCRTTKTSP